MYSHFLIENWYCIGQNINVFGDLRPQSNRVSNFRNLLCYLFPKTNLFDFYSSSQLYIVKLKIVTRSQGHRTRLYLYLYRCFVSGMFSAYKYYVWSKDLFSIMRHENGKNNIDSSHTKQQCFLIH